MFIHWETLVTTELLQQNYQLLVILGEPLLQLETQLRDC